MGRHRWLAVSTAALLLLGGCGAGSDGPSSASSGSASSDSSDSSSAGPSSQTTQQTEDLSMMSAAEAEQRLQTIQKKVRAAAVDLVDGSALALRGGLRGSARDALEGCAEDASGTVTAFQYGVDWRVDVGPGVRRPYLDVLEKMLRKAGYEVEPPRGDGDKQTLKGHQGETVAGFTEYPGQDFVLAGVSGPCLTPPKELRDRWLAHKGSVVG